MNLASIDWQEDSQGAGWSYGSGVPAHNSARLCGSLLSATRYLAKYLMYSCTNFKVLSLFSFGDF